VIQTGRELRCVSFPLGSVCCLLRCARCSPALRASTRSCSGASPLYLRSKAHQDRDSLGESPLFKVFTTPQLRRIIARSEKARFTRLPTEELPALLHPRGKHVLQDLHVPTEPDIVRTMVMAKLTGQCEPATFILDMLPDDWTQLGYEVR